MLLNIDDSLLETENILKDRVIVCVTNILIGFYEANILVQASDEIYEHYKALIKDDRALRALFYLAANNSYAYEIEPFNIVNKDLKGVDVSHKEISIFFFEKTIAIQKAIIMGENENDASFYTYIAHYFYPNIRLAYEKYSGGGSTTSDVLAGIQKKNERFCLVIVDSDMKYPNAPLGGTAKAIEKVWNKRLTQIEVYKLTVHEIENLLPLPFIKEKVRINKKVNLFFTRLRKSEDFGDIWRYYDIKNGIRVSDIESLEDYYHFAEKIYLQVYESKQSFENYLSQLKKCNRNEVTPAIRSDMLDRFVKLNENQKQKYPIFLYDEECKQIAKKVVEFACCRSNDDPLNI